MNGQADSAAPGSEQWFALRRTAAETLLGLLGDERIQWVYAERMEEVVLEFTTDFLARGTSMRGWQHGRGFGPQLELAWWLDGETFDLRLITADGSMPGGVGLLWEPIGPGIETQSPQPGEMLLVGSRDPQARQEKPAWSAARIPRYLHYPVVTESSQAEGDDSVILRYFRYQRQGIPVDYRLVSVERRS